MLSTTTFLSCNSAVSSLAWVGNPCQWLRTHTRRPGLVEMPSTWFLACRYYRISYPRGLLTSRGSKDVKNYALNLNAEKVFDKLRGKISYNIFCCLFKKNANANLKENYYMRQKLRLLLASFLQTSVARAGSTVNFQVVGPLYESLIGPLGKKDALGWTLAISGLTCVLSVLCAMVLLNIFFIY